MLERRQVVRATRAKPELALANAMRGFYPCHCNCGCAKGLHGQHWRTTSFDRAMILLDDAVAAGARPGGSLHFRRD
jgi:hypothetical protein